LGEEAKDKKQCARVSLQASPQGAVIKRQSILALYLYPTLKSDLCLHLYIPHYSSLRASRNFVIPSLISGILEGVAASAAL